MFKMFVFNFDKDLKKYKFIYWFGYPAVGSISVEKTSQFESVSTHFDSSLEELLKANKAVVNTGFFTVLKQNGSASIEPLKNLSQDTALSDLTFGFLDPSSLEDPGWILRNYITYIVRKL